jgi:hypothetical protein
LQKSRAAVGEEMHAFGQSRRAKVGALEHDPRLGMRAMLQFTRGARMAAWFWATRYRTMRERRVSTELLAQRLALDCQSFVFARRATFGPHLTRCDSGPAFERMRKGADFLISEQPSDFGDR